MKYIIKEEEPVEFAEWKNKANSDWTPTYDDLSGKEKKAVYKNLLEEQGYICCYCECELVDNNYHLEHMNPQERKVVDPLEFFNMLCSCQRQLKKGDPRHCGNSKDKWYCDTLFVSPLNPDCENKFAYTFDGQILPKIETDKAALTTIDKLNLDIDKLTAQRSTAIEAFIDEDISEEELHDFVIGYLRDKDDNGGKYNPFYTTIKHLFADLI